MNQGIGKFNEQQVANMLFAMAKPKLCKLVKERISRTSVFFRGKVPAICKAIEEVLNDPTNATMRSVIGHTPYRADYSDPGFNPYHRLAVKIYNEV